MFKTHGTGQTPSSLERDLVFFKNDLNWFRYCVCFAVDRRRWCCRKNYSLRFRLQRYGTTNSQRWNLLNIITTRGIQQVRKPTQLTTRYADRILW